MVTIPDFSFFSSVALAILARGGDSGLHPGRRRGALRHQAAEDLYLPQSSPRAGEVHVLRILPLPGLIPLRLHLPPHPLRSGGPGPPLKAHPHVPGVSQTKMTLEQAFFARTLRHLCFKNFCKTEFLSFWN